MQPFLLLPIGIVNVEKAEKKVTARIQPDQIEYYYPGFHDGTVIVFKSGNSVFTSLSTTQVDTVLLSYSKMSKTNPGKFWNVEIQSN